jgi:hypothetical protein
MNWKMEQSIKNGTSEGLSATTFSGYYPCECIENYCSKTYVDGIHITGGLKLSDKMVCNYFLSMPLESHEIVDDERVCKERHVEETRR